MKLFIVESPSKALTIEKYLKDYGDYKVKSSIGHIRDLPKSNKKAIDIEGGFIPHYEISSDKIKVVADLVALAKKADEIILAPDPDREGEAIAWHLSEIFKDNKIKAPMKRVTFNEITKDAIIAGLNKSRKIDTHLRQAQEARRVLDRLYGYELSGLVWKKVRYGLSAGRVQSPALRIICEREREILAFIPEEYWKTTMTFSAKSISFNALLDHEFSNGEQFESWKKQAEKATWSIDSIKETKGTRAPNAPFTTSSLQQTASSRLGMSPARTMQVAQKLYEAGHITYMRTDSTSISATALGSIAGFVKSEYGEKYHQSRTYKTKSKNAQEAHEAVRPTNVGSKAAGSTREEHSLYELIRSRVIASQMINAEYLRKKIIIGASDKKLHTASLNGSTLMEEGWLKADPHSKSDDVLLPKNIAENDTLDLKDIVGEQKFTTPPNRYSEAGLVKELETRGIGRPSTYASTIKTIVDRGYVDKIDRALKPTDTGMVVSEFLEKNFEKYISDTFTEFMEQKLDDISNGEAEYKETLEHLYTPFKKEVDSKDTGEKVTNLGEADPKFKCPVCNAGMVIKLGRTGRFLSCETFPECNGALTLEGLKTDDDTPLGTDPKTGDNIYMLSGRFGPYVQLGKKTDENPTPKRASISKTLAENITLKDALHALILPRTLGIHPETGEEVIANVGRFGPYVGHGRTFASIKKISPYEVTLEEALAIFKKPKALPKGATLFRTIGEHPKTKKEIRILESKSGLYIPKGLKRIYLEDKKQAENLTLEEAIMIMK